MRRINLQRALAMAKRAPLQEQSAQFSDFGSVRGAFSMQLQQFTSPRGARLLLEQQQRTMVVVTQSSPSDIQAQTPAKVSPAEIPSEINDVDNPNELFVEITPSCVGQVKNLLEKKGKSSDEMFLRVFVDPGGCSGFQYQFELDDELVEEEDFVFEHPDGDGVRVVVDESSLKLINGSKIDYVQEMIKSAFVVADNPQSESACGCGSSFAIKNFSANPALD